MYGHKTLWICPLGRNAGPTGPGCLRKPVMKTPIFPLFIPKSFLSREAAHVEGFAKECAVVTHYRLKNDPEGGGIIVDPEAKLEEELIVGRPVKPSSGIPIKPGSSRTGSSIADQSMGQCGALGNAYAAFFADNRISLAGRSYRPCHSGRSRCRSHDRC